MRGSLVVAGVVVAAVLGPNEGCRARRSKPSPTVVNRTRATCVACAVEPLRCRTRPLVGTGDFPCCLPLTLLLGPDELFAEAPPRGRPAATREERRDLETCSATLAYRQSLPPCERCIAPGASCRTSRLGSVYATLPPCCESDAELARVPECAR